jgi:hypothetical protein
VEGGEEMDKLELYFIVILFAASTGVPVELGKNSKVTDSGEGGGGVSALRLAW